jgi:hypothetical protein
MKSFLSRLTYANVVATIALFAALGGGAYAATQLPKNSVGTRQLKNDAVTPEKLSTRAKASLTGPQGPQGPQGDGGERGPAGPSGESIVLTQRITELAQQVSDLEAAKTIMGGEITALEAVNGGLGQKVSTLESTFAGVTREGMTLAFDGLNIQLTNGTENEGAVNGLGNLILGYNHLPGEQTGSANLVIGERQKFTSYGSLLVGQADEATAPYSIVSGFGNWAGGLNSVALGGSENTASGEGAAVVGGQENIASGLNGSVLGGGLNRASQHGATAVGGVGNLASGFYSLARGGLSNTVSGEDAYAP